MDGFMKKVIVLILLIFLTFSSVCFADGFDVGITGALNTNPLYTIFGGGLHLGLTAYFGRVIGIGAFGNLLYMTGDFDAVYANVLFGPVFRVINGTTFSMPICVGLFVGGGESFTEGWNAVNSFGIGGNITPQFRLGRSAHFFVRIMAALDVIRDDTIIEALISPGIGFSRR
jgi:hypothetical protein